MREAADLIRGEVGRMMGMWAATRSRDQASATSWPDRRGYSRQILISAEKIGNRAGRIDELDFGDSEPADATRLMSTPAQLKSGPVNRAGRCSLRRNDAAAKWRNQRSALRGCATAPLRPDQCRSRSKRHGECASLIAP